jgi:Domain of unknown function (DUF4062)
MWCPSDALLASSAPQFAKMRTFMARPRVFISSTFYDLKQIRSDLELFIRDIGYDPVLHERGAIPYGTKEKLEEYCYREINQVEILVSVIGGRFGSQSDHQPYSISQQELKTAYELGVQVYIFVEAQVLSEFRTSHSATLTTIASTVSWRRSTHFRTTTRSRRLGPLKTLSPSCGNSGQVCSNDSLRTRRE